MCLLPKAATLATTSRAAAAAEAVAPKPTSIWSARATGIWNHALGRVGLVVAAALVLLALLAGLLAPHDPNEVCHDHILAGPSFAFPFGTDELGRDILSRILYGARVSLQVVAGSVGISLVAGSAIGLLSGYLGGRVDDAIMRVMDGLMAFPALVLALANDRASREPHSAPGSSRWRGPLVPGQALPCGEEGRQAPFVSCDNPRKLA